MGEVLAEIDPGNYGTPPFGMARIDKISERRWRSSNPLDFVIKCVCGDCNSGWMSEIENAGQPIIERMIKGEPVTLDAKRQMALATWICLKTVLGQYLDPITPGPHDWLDFLFRHHGPPSTGWFIFAGKYSGNHDPMYQTLDYSVESRKIGTGERTVNSNGILLTLIIKHFAIKVLAHEQIRRSSIRGTNVVFRIWPQSPVPLIWPPRIPITDGNLLDKFIALGQ
jgi:hypothetical protein